MSVHADRDYCPYAPENWRVLIKKPTRLTQENVVRSLYVEDKNNKSATKSQSFSHLSEQQILDRLQVLDNIKPHHAMLQPDKMPLSRTDFLSLPLADTDNDMMPIGKSIKSANAKDNENLDTVLQITKEFLCDYGPRLKQNYDLWQRNLNFDASSIQRNPLLRSTRETSTFINVVLNCPDYAEIFVQQDIDGKALLLLQQDNLTETLGMKLGPAVKLYTVRLQLRKITITKFNVAYKRSNPRNVKGLSTIILVLRYG
uniref:SAM domain-containing protein n=1 Tax=Glossina austeni TaxID=7395 RepID=A0A1A9UI36_GLOAU